MKESLQTKSSEIRNLLFVIGSGVLGAILLAIAALYYYSPTGTYLARNALLSPDSATSLSYVDFSAKNGSLMRYIFDEIEFTYIDPAAKKVKKLHIDLDVYKKFYDSIRNEKSLPTVSDEIKNLFNQSSPAHLRIKVHPERNASQSDAKVFLSTDFVNEGDYYRIQLREQDAIEPYAYFYHPSIYQQALKIFIPSL